MTAGWSSGPMAAFDTETTGPDPMTARIVTACIAVVNMSPAREPMSWLINPGVEIPTEATAVHGITTEAAVERGANPVDACVEILEWLTQSWARDIPVIAYNASYDLTVLDQDLRRNGLAGIGEIGPVIDPLVLDRGLDRYRRGKRTLTAACEHYGVRLDGAHDSTADALAAARVAWRIAQRYPQVGAASLDELMELQAGMHLEWATHFQSYLRSQGKDEVIDTSWPLRAVTA